MPTTGHKPLWFFFALAALMALLVEWYLYHRPFFVPMFPSMRLWKRNAFEPHEAKKTDAVGRNRRRRTE